jgi:hypothetical protein
VKCVAKRSDALFEGDYRRRRDGVSRLSRPVGRIGVPWVQLERVLEAEQRVRRTTASMRTFPMCHQSSGSSGLSCTALSNALRASSRRPSFSMAIPSSGSSCSTRRALIPAPGRPQGQDGKTYNPVNVASVRCAQVRRGGRGRSAGTEGRQKCHVAATYDTPEFSQTC